MNRVTIVVAVVSFFMTGSVEARVVRLNVDRRELVLSGKPFGAARAYEKLSGTVDFAFDPELPRNRIVVDLPLAPRNERGEVEVRADFGNGSLMREGCTLLWMGWQWDVPVGRMRMEVPIATRDGEPITGLVRGNFIPGAGWRTAPLADRGHRAYPVVDPASADHVMTVRELPFEPPRGIPRDKWSFVDEQTVSLDGGFEPGRIYDVAYVARDPRVVGCGLAGTRDLVSFFKYEKGEDVPDILRRAAAHYDWAIAREDE